MTTARGPQSQPPPAGGRGARGGAAGGGPSRPSGWSPLKGLVVVIVAVGLGAYLVDLGALRAPASASGRASHARPSTGATSTTTTTVPPTTTTTVAPGARPSLTVKVLVANASQTNGIAAYYTSKLSAAGWGTLPPVTADATETSSTVYYGSGEQPYALAVASALGLSSSSVTALSTAAPVGTTANANVLVVAGDDLAAKVPAASG